MVILNYPPKMENPQEIDNLSRRYVVGWELKEIKTLVFVYDKLSRRVVYKILIKERKAAYPYIQEYYGIDNCVKPRQINVSFYES